MGVDSPVAGKAGAVRIQRVGGVALSAAEAHGKRLDVAGSGRVVREAEALSTTGLDLNRLYDEHVEGAKVQKSATKALHMVLQFPADLVDGDDAELMLSNARSFAEELFGTSAIFADRVDRDEKSRHVVDLFIAPKYEKETKRRSQTAISTSRHLKALAVTRGRAPTLRGQGQALQDAWYEHLRDRMKLAVQRGEPKKRPGPDWQSAEALEAERLKRLSEKLERQREHLRKEREDLKYAKEMVDFDRGAAKAEKELVRKYWKTLKAATEKASAAADSLAEIVPADLVKAFGLMRTVSRKAFVGMGWLDDSNRFTEKSGLTRAEQDDLSNASKAIGKIVAAHEAVAEAAEMEDDGPGYDSGPSGP